MYALDSIELEIVLGILRQATLLLFLLDIALDYIFWLKVFEINQTNTAFVSFLNRIDFRLQKKGI